MAAVSGITTPFNAKSTAREVLDGVSLEGKRVVVTGASSGIGVETARELARAGAMMHLAVRDVVAGQKCAEDIAATTGNPNVAVAALDLTDLNSIRRFAASWRGPLDVLINNAGVMGTPLLRTAPGWELQFATNHVGHVALATGLHPALATAQGARVVVVSSSGHRRSPVVFDDVHFERRDYDTWLAYGQSKTANILFAVEAAKRWARDGIVVNALHPGVIYTGLQRWLDRDESRRDENIARRRQLEFKSVQQGAATTTLLAGSPTVEGVTGRYFEDCNEAVLAGPGRPFRGVQPFALDPEAADRLWTYTEQLLACVPWSSQIE
jgi:NAD(P)-dependent dehydrogenase (short-subunit alcohol dehydrogenase family)